MEDTRLHVREENKKKKDSSQGLCKDRHLPGEDSSNISELVPKKVVKRENSRWSVVVNMIQSKINKVFLKDSFFHVHGPDNRIPKHVVSVDEKYLRRCMEFIHVNALKSASVNSRSANLGISSESLNAVKFISADAWDTTQFVSECPVEAGNGTIVISANAAEHWAPGTVMGSKRMINILSSPLFQQFGASYGNDNLSSICKTDATGLICYDFMDSPGGLSVTSSYELKKETPRSPSGLSVTSSHKLEKETPRMQSHKFGYNPTHKRLASTSSTISTCSDWLSSASPIISQGMLQCTWKEGIPYFVFSADDQKEVYVAKLRKVDPTNDKALDYVYVFHSNKGMQKDGEITDNDAQLVGKMNVSTSFTLCPNSCKIMETEFVLFGNRELYEKEMYTSSHTPKKKGLSKVVSQVFRASSSTKRRTLSKFDGSSAIMESCPWEPYAVGGANLLDASVPSNFELAAIVVKNHLPCNQQETVGGWGLKFLKKSKVKETTLPSESCNRNTGDCSSSMSILVPAGFHGGPRTTTNGPSTLTERWRSGGHCDCGGWDVGCPLTVFQSRSSQSEVLWPVDTQGECKSVDFVTQGSKDFSPSLRMVNVHDGLYFIHFQSPLSALQSFSIAVAMIHTQSPTLRPNSALEL